MADFAGAVAAIKDRLSANWLTTRIEEANVTPTDPFPPIDSNGNPEAFAVIEVIANGSDIQGVAQNSSGAQMNIDFGHILVHVLVPVGTGTETALAYASTIAAIFRQKEFYNDTAGFAVRTWRPHIGPASGAEIEGVADGTYWRITMTAEFEYLHID